MILIPNVATLIYLNWTPPSAQEDTLSGIQTHIRHLRRKQTAMCKWLESVSEVGPEEDKSKAEQ